MIGLSFRFKISERLESTIVDRIVSFHGSGLSETQEQDQK